MPSMTEQQWDDLEDDLDTTRLLAAVDLLDRLRATTKRGKNDALLRYREAFLEMHRLATLAFSRSDTSALRDFFELAGELAGEAGGRSELPEAVQRLLLDIVGLFPDQLSEDD